jgi:nitrate reductase cytochrome c-type subunit
MAVQEVTAVTDFCVSCHDVAAHEDDGGMYVEFEPVDSSTLMMMRDAYPELYVCSSCLVGGD